MRTFKHSWMYRPLCVAIWFPSCGFFSFFLSLSFNVSLCVRFFPFWYSFYSLWKFIRLHTTYVLQFIPFFSSPFFLSCFSHSLYTFRCTQTSRLASCIWHVIESLNCCCYCCCGCCCCWCRTSISRKYTGKGDVHSTTIFYRRSTFGPSLFPSRLLLDSAETVQTKKTLCG